MLLASIQATVEKIFTIAVVRDRYFSKFVACYNFRNYGGASYKITLPSEKIAEPFLTKLDDKTCSRQNPARFYSIGEVFTISHSIRLAPKIIKSIYGSNFGKKSRPVAGS